MDHTATARLFEEIKVMFQDLPERLQEQMYESLGPRMRRRRRMHPGMLMDMIHHSVEDFGDPAVGWLMILSNFRDEAPWLYEVGLDIYHAMQQHDPARVAKAIERFDRMLHSILRGPMAEMMIDSPEMDMAVYCAPPLHAWTKAHHRSSCRTEKGQIGRGVTI